MTMTVTYDPSMGAIFWWPWEHNVAKGWSPPKGVITFSSWIVPGTYEE